MTNPRELIELLREHRNQLSINVIVLHYPGYASLSSTQRVEVEKMLPIILLLGLNIVKPINEYNPGEFGMTVNLG